MPGMKRNIKDSVFTYLFSQPGYARELYLTLHPLDRDVTEAELKIVTLENVLSTGQYNDLGILVRNRLIVLMEAQSTFSINIVLRLFLYLAESYKEYVKEHKLSLYSTKKVSIPCPELYMVYTGDQKSVPDTLRLSSLYEGHGSVELEVKVLREGDLGGILGEYMDFCAVCSQQVKLYGRTQQAIDETIRICKEKDILTPFLESREKEVQDIMVTLFNQEQVWEIERHNIATAARQEGMQEGIEKGLEKGLKKGMAKGMEKGVEEGIRALVHTLRGLSVEDKVVAQKLVEQFGLLPRAAEEKVKRYWKQ